MLFYSAWSRYGGVSGSMMGWSCAMKIRRRTHLVRDLMLATHGTMKTKTRTTHVVRAAIVCAGAALWQWPQRSDRVVERVWEWARGSAVFGLDSFEPLLVVVAFQVWMVGFHALNRFHRRTKRLGKWKLDGRDSQDSDPRAYWVGLFYLAPIVLFDVLSPRRGDRLGWCSAAQRSAGGWMWFYPP